MHTCQKSNQMAKTKKQVIAFLDKQVGKKVPEKTASYLDGQCVTLIKALFEYLGVPNPYAARGHAKDAGNAYLAQNIAEKGRGEITICVNPTMGYIGGVYYGHIWIDIKGVANYEQNGARALITTKNTRPISQATQLINIDKYIEKEVDEMTSKEKEQYNKGLVMSNIKPLKEGNIVCQFTRDASQFKLDSIYNGTRLAHKAFKKGHVIIAQSYVDITYKGDKDRYYIADADLGKGDLIGMLSRDVTILKKYE